MKITEKEKKFDKNYTLKDIYDAVEYGFRYATESQNDGFVPKGNTLQWLQSKDELIVGIIHKINYSGKWIEFWLKGEDQDLETFHHCSKITYFNQAILATELNLNLLNYGAKGMSIVFKKLGQNFEIDRVYDNRKFHA